MAHEAETQGHIGVIRDYYDRLGRIEVTRTAPEVLVERYLSKVTTPDEFAGKVILEMGAGCSQYTRLFLESGCTRYYANDLIAERLAVNRVDDPRYIELSGDFRSIHVPEPADIVFANLTMMYLVPMLDEFVIAVRDRLKPGGLFFSMDPNFLCPLTLYRRIRESRRAIPTRLFNPLNYANRFRKAGFTVRELVPFTAQLPWTKGNWILGTNFWLSAQKQRL